MNANPTQPDSTEIEELARLLPGPAERDLPGDRHQRVQEFVMSQIHQDLRPVEPETPRRSPKRRPVFIASALTAVAAATAAVVIGAHGSGGTATPPGRPAAAPLSGRQFLLAAAETAERTPDGSGTYWYVKTTLWNAGGGALRSESWTRRDGRIWFRGDKSGGKVVGLRRTTPFRLGGIPVTFGQLRGLPATPDALKATIARTVAHGNVKTSAGRADAATRQRLVFDGLVSLVSQLPATPKVRAAAFRAIASSPDVKDLGPVTGGHGLLIGSGPGKPVRLVVDPASSQVRESSYFVTADGAEVIAPDGATIVARWTNRLQG